MHGEANPTTSPSPDRLTTRQEALRQGYLEAMGIQTWYPRYQLSNARPPRPFDWIQEDAGINTASNNDASRNTTANLDAPSFKQNEPTPASEYTPTRAADILGQFLPPSPEIEEASQADSSPDGSQQTSKEAALSKNTSRFRLIVQPVNDDCLVVAEMPHSGLNQFSRYHQRLLNDILRALQLMPDRAPAFREFVWPMTNNKGLLSQMDQDDQAGADAVAAFLNNQYGLHRRRIVLLLGQSAARFVMNPKQTFGQLRGIQPGTHPEQTFAITYGLNELMKQPVLKADAWQDLSPLLLKTTELKTAELNPTAQSKQD